MDLSDSLRCLAQSAHLNIVGVTERGRLIVSGPTVGVRPFIDEASRLLGRPVEAIPIGVQARATPGHDLAQVTALPQPRTG